MKKYYLCLLITLVLITGAAVVQAEESTTVNLSTPDADVGHTVTVSGVSSPDHWISVKVMDGSGNIVVFDVVKSDLNGNYSCSFVVPNYPGGTLAVVVGYGSNVALTNLTVNSGGLDTTAPTVANGTIVISDLTDTGVTLSWNKATDNESAQEALQYLVYRSDSNNLDTVQNIEANGIAIGSYAANIDMKEITGLSGSTTYYFNIIVKDEVGNKTAYTMKVVTTEATQVVTYSVTYYDNGGTGTAPTESDKSEGTTFTVADNTFTAPSGKQFKEWNTASDGEGTGYSEGATVTMPASDLTLYAIWQDIPVLSDKADLSSLTISAGILTPDFDPAKTSYSASVGSGVSSINVTPTTVDSNATITVNGTGVASGNASSVSLSWGDNTITIVVTANSGLTKTYKITVNRASSGGGSSSSGDTTSAPTPTSNALISVNGSMVATLTASLDSRTGIATLNLDRDQLNGALAEAEVNSEGNVTVTVEIAEIEGANSYVTELPATVLNAANTVRVEIKTGIGTVTVPSNMLGSNEIYDISSVGISIGMVDVSDFNEELKEQIGDKPVIELKLTSEGRTIAWNNPAAPVTVSIPYTPTEEELADPEHITVWYIDGSGNVVEVPNGRYDRSTGTVTFSTTHFSHYAVVYVTKTFDDLGSAAWAKKPIEVLASKGILKGISETEYAPGANITRADFLYFLVRTLGVDAKIDGNFDDIKSDAYYYKEIAIAKKLGITSGIGINKFNPDASITRQDMMILTERALRMLNRIEVQGTASDLDKFTDKSLVGEYAVDSIVSLVKEELIKGDGQRINPLGNTTRAEAAAFLYRIYNKY